MKLYKITYNETHEKDRGEGRGYRFVEKNLFQFITTDNIIEFINKFQEVWKNGEEEIKKDITDILFIDTVSNPLTQ